MASPAAPTPKLGLTTDQLNQYNDDGFLIIPDALSPATVATLLQETHTMLADFPLETHPMTRFTTGEDSSNSTAKHVGDDYFLTSGDKIRFFFEEDAFSPDPVSNEPRNHDHHHLLRKPKHLAINKIGHALHSLSPPFRTATMSKTHANIARQLGFRDPRVLQSMVICKQPEIGGRVPPHQDSTFLYTDPPSAVGFWIALEDATAENGCLSFAMGSHLRTPVGKRFVRKKEAVAVPPDGGEQQNGRTEDHDMDGGTTFADVGTGARFPKNLEQRPAAERRPNDKERKEDDEIYELGPVKAGTLVLIHGNLLHKSEKNTSSKSRFIYTFHVIEGGAEYDGRNWLQPPSTEGFSRLVADRL